MTLVDADPISPCAWRCPPAHRGSLPKSSSHTGKRGEPLVARSRPRTVHGPRCTARPCASLCVCAWMNSTRSRSRSRVVHDRRPAKCPARRPRWRDFTNSGNSMPRGSRRRPCPRGQMEARRGDAVVRQRSAWSAPCPAISIMPRGLQPVYGWRISSRKADHVVVIGDDARELLQQVEGNLRPPVAHHAAQFADLDRRFPARAPHARYWTASRARCTRCGRPRSRPRTDRADHPAAPAPAFTSSRMRRFFTMRSSRGCVSGCRAPCAAPAAGRRACALRRSWRRCRCM